MESKVDLRTGHSACHNRIDRHLLFNISTGRDIIYGTEGIKDRLHCGVTTDTRDTRQIVDLTRGLIDIKCCPVTLCHNS